MNKISKYVFNSFFLVLVFSLTGCYESNKRIDTSENIDIGDGFTRTFMIKTELGKITQLGIEIDATGFTNLPHEDSDGVWDIKDSEGNVTRPCCGHEYILPLVDGIKDTPFKQVVLNWNPHGHAPAHIFDLPHFDFHFYTISKAERLSIEAPLESERCMVTGLSNEVKAALVNCENYVKGTKALAAELMPPNYTDLAVIEPGMGNHMIDLTSPVFAGEHFSHTWIWGVWDGDITYYEPMITLEFLKSLKQKELGKVCKAVSMPEAVSEPGLYPTTYCMRYVPGNDVYRISLEEWKYFN